MNEQLELNLDPINCDIYGESHSPTERVSRSKEEYSKARELWIEQNCECGISEKTGKWSEKVFKSFGCNCETGDLLFDARLKKIGGEHER